MTTVVHVRDVLDRLKAGDPDVVYIGRAMPRQGLKGSPWANPFRISSIWPREQVIAMYRSALLADSGITAVRQAQRKARDAALRTLRGKTLACWCKGTGKSGEDVPCHGDVLAELAEL